jgi:hypothetical protein
LHSGIQNQDYLDQAAYQLHNGIFALADGSTDFLFGGPMQGFHALILTGFVIFDNGALLFAEGL